MTFSGTLAIKLLLALLVLIGGVWWYLWSSSHALDPKPHETRPPAAVLDGDDAVKAMKGDENQPSAAPTPTPKRSPTPTPPARPRTSDLDGDDVVRAMRGFQPAPHSRRRADKR